MPRKAKVVEENHKENIIKFLEIIMDFEELNKETYKVKAYKTAINNLSQLDKISSVEDVKGLTGVGKKIHDKIDEYFQKGKISEVEKILSDDKYILKNKLMNIYGVGPSKIIELTKKISKFEDLYLPENSELLNDKQQIGLKYYDDLLQRIPYKEASMHNKLIGKLLKKIDKNIEYCMVGSFRRKNKTAGDIDILIKSNSNFKLKDFIMKMQYCDEYILEVLANGTNKFMGICKIGDNPARRIDILVADSSYYYFALLYFTGSYTFNILMRNKALEKNLSLSEYGFKYKDTKEDATEINNKVKSEEDIFKLLDMEYVEPKKR
jgi:DNA polymerase/3'-5' exonuclease PolX